MKHLSTLMLLCIISVLSFSSCSKDNDEPAPQPKNLKSEYTIDDYYQWDAWTSYVNGSFADNNDNWKPGSEQYHYGECTASQSCKVCPTGEQIQVYLGNSPYWDNGFEGAGRQTYKVDGQEYHSGVWLKKYDKCNKMLNSHDFIESDDYKTGLTDAIRTGGEYFFLPATGERLKFIHDADEFVDNVDNFVFGADEYGFYWLRTSYMSTYAAFLCFSNETVFVSGNTRNNSYLTMVVE